MAADATDLLDRWADSMAAGRYPLEIHNDADLFELEMEHIFRRGWQFVGFEAEVPEPGDYVVRPIADDDYIITRDEDGEVQILLNSCAHQGTPVCTMERGNSSHFRCRYHGWTFDNSGDLVGVTMLNEAYGDEKVDKAANGLQPIGKFGSYKGLLFACPDPDAEPLEEFLGEFTWYLDFFAGTEEAGLEVHGPLRHTASVNWKIPVMNTIGDTYHGPTTHRSVIETGIIGGDSQQFGSGQEFKYHITAGPGGVELAKRSYLEQIPQEMRDAYREALTDEQWGLLEDGWLVNNGGMYPNLQLTNLTIRIDEDTYAPVKQFRMWVPTGPNECEAFHWNIIESDMSEELKADSLLAQCFYSGPGGTIVQDDLDTWPRISTAAGGTYTGRKEGRVDMKMGWEEDTAYPGPGTVYATKLNEANTRTFLERCLRTIREGVEANGGEAAVAGDD